MKKYLALILTTVFTLAAMTVMIVFMMTRDTAAESPSLTGGDNPDGGLVYVKDEKEEVLIDEKTGSGMEGYFCIPLEEGVREEDVEIIEKITDNLTIISIPVKNEDYYYNNNLSGSGKNISKIGFDIVDGKAVFEIKTEGLVGLQKKFEDGSLYLRYDEPGEIYDRIILIDAGHGGEDTGTEAYDICEKDVTLAVAKNITVSEDSGIGLYYTRTDDSTLKDEEREEFAKKLEPDLIISIHANADSDTRVTRGVETYYNKDEAESAARRILRRLSNLTDTSAKKLEKKEKMPGFEDVDIPCVFIRLGYMTNKSEAMILADEDYQKEAAKAIEEIF